MNDQPNRIWAPWRYDYLQSAVDKADGCFLCDAVAAGNDREHLLLHRDELVFIIMNLYPYNNGHLLVAPYRHVGELDELSSEESAALGEVTRKAVKWMNEAYQPQGYNIGLNLGRVAGAGLPDHLHWHIVPRWDGDHNFMPVLGYTKVISEGLLASYDRIRQVIDKGHENK